MSEFNWQAYLNNYPDLRDAGINTRDAAIKHWETYGKHEGRTLKEQLNIHTDMRLIDWDDYLHSYPDLIAAGINTTDDAIMHWLKYGNAEERIIKPIYKIEFPSVAANGIIPHTIYQTWKSKDLPKSMGEVRQQIIAANPDFKYELFDDNDCREFIKTHFPPQVLYSYDCLIPGAYRADLWRYCILYLYGGVYLDIKFVPVDWFSFDSLINDEHFCFDHRQSQPSNGISVYNAIMICAPGNKIMKRCINSIYKNVLTRTYGSRDLEPTGPHLLGKFLTPNDCTLKLTNKGICIDDIQILMPHNKYREDQKKSSVHYSLYWNSRTVYDNKGLLTYL